jgi:hypothetical protein
VTFQLIHHVSKLAYPARNKLRQVRETIGVKGSIMANPEEEVLHQLTNDHAEGTSDLFGEEAEFEADGFEAEAGLEEDALEDSLEADSLDFEAEDGFEEDGFEEDGLETEDALEAEGEALIPALSAALRAESEDAFFGGLFNAIKKAAPVVGKIAQAAAPILQSIPFPPAQIAGQIAGLAGNLAGEAEEAGEGEDGVLQRAAEAAAEAAVADRRARPVVVGLAARQLAKHHAAALPRAHRQQIVRQVHRVAKTLTRAGGPHAIRALPKIAASVARTADARGTPIGGRLAVLRRSARRVARHPRLLHKLAQPTARGRRLARMMRIRPGMPSGIPGGMGGGYAPSAYGTGRHRRRRRYSGGAYVVPGWGAYGWPGSGAYGSAEGTRRITMRGPCTITITPLGHRFFD